MAGSRRKKGQGSIRPPRWAGDKYLARYTDHTGRERSKGFSTRRDAEAFLQETRVDLRRGVWHDPRPGQTKFSAWAENYLTLPGREATTMARDESVARTHLLPILGQKTLGSITPHDVRRVVETMTSKKLAPKTIHTNYGVLRAMLNGAVEADLIAKAPLRGVKLPVAKRKTKIRFLDAHELQQLVAEMPIDYQAMVFLVGVAGLRWSEVAGLRVRHLDVLRCTITISDTLPEVNGKLIEKPSGKSDASSDTLTLLTFLVEKLAEHLARRGLRATDADAFLFTAPHGGPLRPSNFRQRVFDPAAERAGFGDMTFHHLRHTSAGFLIDGNLQGAVIQQRMRHRSFRTTADVYGHVLPSTDATAVDHLQQLFEPKIQRREHG